VALRRGFGWLGRLDSGSKKVANGAGRNDRSPADLGSRDTSGSDLSVDRSSPYAQQIGGGINAVAKFIELIV